MFVLVEYDTYNSEDIPFIDTWILRENPNTRFGQDVYWENTDGKRIYDQALTVIAWRYEN